MGFWVTEKDGMDTKQVGNYVHNIAPGESVEVGVRVAVQRFRARFGAEPDTVLVPSCSDFAVGARRIGSVTVRVCRYAGVATGTVWVGRTERAVVAVEGAQADGGYTVQKSSPQASAVVDNWDNLPAPKVEDELKKPMPPPAPIDKSEGQLEREEIDRAVIEFVEARPGYSWSLLRQFLIRLRPEIGRRHPTVQGVKGAYLRAKGRQEGHV